MLTFPSKEMTLGKITVDSSVRYIPKSGQTREIKQNTIKNNSLPKKLIKINSQNSKSFHKNLAAEGFATLK